VNIRKIKNTIKAFIPYRILCFYKKTKIKDVGKSLFQIEVHLTEHCNLKCKGCWHFSCIADEEFLSLEVFEKDLRRLSELTDKLSVIKLLGGEPLLHPQIIDFIKISRNYFPNTLIQITTNGILLEKQDNIFWAACRDNNVTVSISTYPININIDIVEKIARNQRVYLIYDENRAKIYHRTTNKNFMVKWNLDISGKQNHKKNYFICGFHSGECVTLRDGKIFACFTAAHVKFFNKRFHKNLEITDKDYIDIHKIKNVDEIYTFLQTPFPFCKYCVPLKSSCVNWETTKNEIEEWT
jgi:MoaA/NifB/PqqE/SkfB family radical SAM enzyme